MFIVTSSNSISQHGYLIYTSAFLHARTYMYEKCFSPPIGILPAPQQFNMIVSNSSVSLYWVAPASLQMSTPPTISHYVLSNNLTNSTKIFNNPTTCNLFASCNYSLDLRDPFFTLVQSNEGESATMLGYNGTVEFTLFAVNGAGNGNATTYMMQKKTQTG